MLLTQDWWRVHLSERFWVSVPFPKLKAAKTVGKFLPCMECGYDKPSMFFEGRGREPQPVKRK